MEAKGGRIGREGGLSGELGGGGRSSSSGEEFLTLEEGVAENDCSNGFGSRSKSDRICRVGANGEPVAGDSVMEKKKTDDDG